MAILAIIWLFITIKNKDTLSVSLFSGNEHTRDEIFQYTNEYTESPEYTKSIQTSLRSLPSIPKSYPRVTQKDTAVNQIS